MRVREVLRVVAWLPMPGRDTDPSAGDDDHVGDVDAGNNSADDGDDEVDDGDGGADDGDGGADDGDDGADDGDSKVDDGDSKVDLDVTDRYDEASGYAEQPSDWCRPEAEAPVPPHGFAGVGRDARPRPHRDRGCVDRAQEHRDTGGEADA